MGKLIVVVDDSRTVRASLEYTLSKAGYTVQSADDGKTGLQLLENLVPRGMRPSMIIADINMPIMDGITFIKEMRKRAELRFVPVLVLTTESQQQKKLEGKQAGASGWLVKPFNQEQLIGIIQKFVK